MGCVAWSAEASFSVVDDEGCPLILFAPDLDVAVVGDVGAALHHHLPAAHLDGDHVARDGGGDVDKDIDEDISVEGLLAGRPSGESQESFKKWLAKRSQKAS